MILPAAVPVLPDPDQARRWAVEELSGREYGEQRPGLIEQLTEWLLRRLEDLFSGLGGGTGSLAALVVGVAVVLVTVAVLLAGRGVVARRQRSVAVFAQAPRSPAQHRQDADAAAARGDWRTAVVERFRAVARELEVHAVLVPLPGRTADEVAAEAGTRLPDLADRLHAAARLFDDVRYGDRPADQAADASLRALDDAVRRARTAGVG